MIKGSTKRVVVVKSPDPKIFEEAIFIVREDAPGRNVMSAGDLLLEAQRIANGYVESGGKHFKRRITPFLCGGAGALLMGLVWALTTML